MEISYRLGFKIICAETHGYNICSKIVCKRFGICLPILLSKSTLMYLSDLFKQNISNPHSVYFNLYKYFKQPKWIKEMSEYQHTATMTFISRRS